MIKKLIAGLFMVSVLMVTVALPAVADPTCYTGCAPGTGGPSPGGPSPGGPGPGGIIGGVPTPTPGAATSPSTPAPVPLASQSVPSGGLPFTGGDVEQSLAIAVVLVGAGFGMVRISRRRGRAAH